MAVGLRLYVLADDYVLTGSTQVINVLSSVDAVREEMRQEREHNSSWLCGRAALTDLIPMDTCSR